MPRVKPPRTVEHGLWAQPTILNNVETFANVPLIIRNGAAWYRSIGTGNSPGTKAFALTGNVNNTGLIEVPMGTTLRKIIFDIGGGIKNGKQFKAVQIGGPSGGCCCASAEHLDLPLDFDSLKKIGAMIGSGGLVVMDEDNCMVEVARFFMRFTQNESCGKCVPCREGTKRMLEILDRILANEGTLEDLDLLEELADTITNTALCGLGQSACKPVQSTLRYFRDEYLRARGGPPLPHLQQGEAPPRHRRGEVQGLRQVPQDLPHGGHLRQSQAGPHHRSGKVRQLRRLREQLPLRRHRRQQGGLSHGKGNHVYRRPAGALRRGEKRPGCDPQGRH